MAAGAAGRWGHLLAPLLYADRNAAPRRTIFPPISILQLQFTRIIELRHVQMQLMGIFFSACPFYYLIHCNQMRSSFVFESISVEIHNYEKGTAIPVTGRGGP
jgi:hypothetical protein